MRRFAQRWGRLWPELAATERWLLPGECLLCQRAVSDRDDPLVCAICRSRFRPLPSLRCTRCGQPILTGVDCRACVEWPESLWVADSAVWMDERARIAVHLLKYEGWWRLADALATCMQRLDPLRAGGALVPVPLGAARHRARGYNQSAKLASSLGRLTGLEVRTDLLRRGRETATQTRLTPEARAANVRGAFQAVQRAPGRVILVDDVFTTGATLAAAAAALAAAGTRQVAAVTFARAELPLAALSRQI